MSLNIHNTEYNITDFAKYHPGGSDVLKNASNTLDATPMFESYHSLRNREGIIGSASEFITNKNPPTIEGPSYTYSPDGFYNILSQRVRELYKTRQSIKATWWWVFKSFAILTIGVYTGYGLFQYSNEWYDYIWRGGVIGLCHVSMGFNVMHDASHFAISTIPSINEILSRIVNASLLWNHHIWARHHVYAHHSFTGEINHDPDVKNTRPFLRKSRFDRVDKYIPSFLPLQSILAIPILCAIPGQVLGQSLVYLFAVCKGRVWGVPITRASVFGMIDVITYILTLTYHTICLWYYPMYVLSYHITANTLYYLCVAPDHDTFESAILHHDNESGARDWGELQVRRSANFAINYPFVCELFGGINYQIEHHLFPGMSHVHYPIISPIVKRTCAEFGIPYQSTSWIGAIVSCLKLYSYASS